MVKVNITKKIEGDRYCPVILADNGRIKPDWVIVNGKPERHPEGAYYIDWTDDAKKRKRKAVGTSPANALARKLRKEAEMEATAQGIRVLMEDPAKRRRVDATTVSYLEEIKLTKKHKTFQAYSKALEYFQESCKKIYMEDIDRTDMLRFSAFLRDEMEQAPRSVANKFENIMTFLKSQGIIGIVRKGDYPTYVETEPEIYEKEDLEIFLGACEPHERLWFNYFLMTGMREQEVIYTMQRNIHPTHLTVSMKWKSEYNWSPKGYKEREIPVPGILINEIVAARKTDWHGRDLLFSTESGLPKMDFLHCCKAISKRAGLDPADWWLHKFRATFATWHLQNNVDIRTVQKWMGHVDIESTMRYLKPARNEQVRDKVNSTFLSY